MGAERVSKETIEWLLDPENPPVRYLTLTRLLDRPAGSPEVREAARRLGDYLPTRRILREHQRVWREGAKLYAKYRGGYWQLLFLGEFLAPRELPGVAEAVEFVLSHRRPFGEGDWWGIHCLNANLLRAMVSLGYGKDPRVVAGLEHLAEEILAARSVPCFIIDWTLHAGCHMALPKVLLALTALPEQRRSAPMVEAARVCVERLLEREVAWYVYPQTVAWQEHLRENRELPASWSLKPEKRLRIREAKREFLAARDRSGERKEKLGWRRFGFPLHYNSDILEAMRALAQAGAPRRSPRVRRALERIRERRGPDGRWKLGYSLNGRMISNVERLGQPSRWITLHALQVLRHFGGLGLP